MRQAASEQEMKNRDKAGRKNVAHACGFARRSPITIVSLFSDPFLQTSFKKIMSPLLSTEMWWLFI
jgi:hypothetical protein